MLRSPASLQEGALQRPGAKQSAPQEGARKNTVEPNKRYVVYVCMYVCICMCVYVCICLVSVGERRSYWSFGTGATGRVSDIALHMIGDKGIPLPITAIKY